MTTKINTSKAKRKNFIRAYGMVPGMHQKKVKEEIMKECGWNFLSVFHCKRKGSSKITLLEIPVIEKHFAEYNIDAWTGKYLS